MFDSDRVNVPIIGAMVYARDGQRLIEIGPERCPRGHQLGPRLVLVGWNHGHRLRQYTCVACIEVDSDSGTWCVAASPIPPETPA